MYPYQFYSKRPLFGQNPDSYSTPYRGDLFGQPKVDEINSYQPQPPVEQQSRPDFGQAYAELMKNESNGPNLSAYSKFVQEGPPKREDYKPSKLRRLAAILSGVTLGYNNPEQGINTAATINETPYRKALETNRLKGGYLKEAADIENTGYGRQLATLKAVQEYGHQERTENRLNSAEERATRNEISLSESRRVANETHRLTQQKMMIDLQTAGYEKEVSKLDGHVYMVNKLDPTKKIDLGKFDETLEEKSQREIKTDVAKARQVSPITFGREAEIQNRGFKQQDKAREDSQAFQAEQQRLRETEINKRNESRARRPETINQARLKNGTVVESLIKKNPEKYKGIVKPNADNTGYIMGENPGMDSPNYLAYKELFDALYNGIPGIEPLPDLGKIK